MSTKGELGRALISRQWWWVTLIVLALMALFARLGIWQLDRLEQRRAANAQLVAALDSTPINLNDAIEAYRLLVPSEISDDLANRDVEVRGTYDFSGQRIVKLQSWNGRAGVHLITPFLIEGTDTAILVNRGWIPDADYAAGNAYDSDTGTQMIKGYIALTETISRRTPDAIVPVDPGTELFRVDIATLSDFVPYPLAPFYLKLIPGDGTPASLPVPVPKEVDLSEGPHLDYALQWFVFSIGLGVAYVVYVYRSLRRRESGAVPDAQPTHD